MLFGGSMSQYKLLKHISNPELASVGPPSDFSVLKNCSEVGSILSNEKFFLGLPLPLPLDDITAAPALPEGST